MQTNSNKIIIVLLVVVIIILGYFAFFKNKQTNNSVVVPTGQTQTNQNPNGPDYQPNGNPVVNQQTSDYKTYQGNGFSFNYDSSAILKSSVHPEAYNTSLVQLTEGKESTSVIYYPDVTISNFNTNKTTGSTSINGKTFFYNDVLVEGGNTSRTYFYRVGNKVIVISTPSYQNQTSLVDLGSIEVK